MPMLLKENGTAGRRERSQLNEKNRRANESSLIVKSFVGVMTLWPIKSENGRNQSPHWKTLIGR